MNTNISNQKKCGFWRGHNWSQWQLINDGRSMGIVHRRTNAVIGQMFVQQRDCKDCGLSQFRKDMIDVND